MIVREKRARDKGNGGRLGGIVKPRGHGFIVEGDKVFQCPRVPGAEGNKGRMGGTVKPPWSWIYSGG